MPLLAHRIALQPTPAQETLFRKAAGCARLAYNEALRWWIAAYHAGQRPTWQTAQRLFIARVDREFPFLREVPCHVYYQPFRHLGQAFAAYVAKRARHPTRKRKHGCRLSFKVGKVRVEDHTVILPRIGAVRMRESLRFTGRIISATISQDAGRWEISLQVEIPAEAYPIPHPPRCASVGIDVGLSAVVSTSDGTQVAALRQLQRHRRRRRRLHRRLSRAQQGSARRRRARLRLQRLYRRMRCVRSNFLHHISTQTVRDNQTIVIEDLHIRGLLKNHCLAEAISDAGWGELRRQLTYKCVRYGRTLLAAHRFYPSTKRCSQCGVVKEAMPLRDRIFVCGACGFTSNRDVNAACNLQSLNHTPAEGEIHVRGECTVVVRQGVLQHHPTRRSANPGATTRGERAPTTP